MTSEPNAQSGQVRKNYVAAFRTYTWNSTVEELARRFFYACPNGRHVVLADETRGPLRIPGYEVLSHTEDTTSLGLIIQPRGKSLWFNVDYGLYFARSALPEYDYYLFSESDLAVNLNLESMIATAASERVDVITHGVKPSTPDWHWHKNGSAVFEHPWRSLLFFMLLSGRAIDVLLEARRKLGIEFRKGQLPAWPFCESFVPSVLKQAGMSFAEVERFADTRDLNFRPKMPVSDPRVNMPGTLVHSVISDEDHRKVVVSKTEPREWFDSSSPYRRYLDGFAFNEYADELRRAFESRTDHAGLSRLAMQMKQEGLTVEESDDLAYCKPSMTSSTSKWSHFSDRQKDAAGANGSTLHAEYGFHTAKEDSPWWMVDLCNEFVIDRVSIVNRTKRNARFLNFGIESSIDGSCWIIRYSKINADPVSCDDVNPFSVNFLDPFVARFVRIKLIGNDYLHLRRICVFGRAIL